MWSIKNQRGPAAERNRVELLPKSNNGTAKHKNDKSTTIQTSDRPRKYSLVERLFLHT